MSCIRQMPKDGFHCPVTVKTSADNDDDDDDNDDDDDDDN